MCIYVLNLPTTLTAGDNFKDILTFSANVNIYC